MRNGKLFTILLIVFLTAGCAAPGTPTIVESPVPSIPPTFTATAFPTSTPQPENPTITPEPPLKTNGPYFAYFQEVNGIRQLVFLDADGMGRKAFQLPQAINDAYAVIQPPGLDIRWVSPDGHWLVFHTGSGGSYGEMPQPGTSDLTLNLLDLETGEEQVVTPLLSKDYPNNFIKAAGNLHDPDITAQSLYDAFISGITEAVAWSPNGKYLAFAGQMDGLSSDLYVYDVKEKTIKRLSSGDQELQWIQWSPDGKQILHSSVFSVGMGMTFDIYAATLDDTSIPYLSTNILYGGIENWLNSHQYFENDGENGPGEYGLRLVDIATGKITKLWDGSFLSYGFEPNGKWLVVNAVSPDISPTSDTGADSSFIPGPYLINVETLKKTKIEFPSNEAALDHTIIPFGLGGQIFILMGDSSDSYFLSENLELTPLDLKNAKISVSPNQEYWIAVTDREAKIFSGDNTLIKTSTIPLSKPFVGEAIWRPDSSGLFLVSETYILSMDVPSGDIEVVETNLLNDNYNRAYAWIGSR